MLKLSGLMTCALLMGMVQQAVADNTLTDAIKASGDAPKFVAPGGVFSDPASPLLCRTTPIYIPLEPFTAHNYEDLTKQADGTWKREVNPFPTADNAAVNKLLPNLETSIEETVNEVDGSFAGLFGGKWYHKVITMDFAKFLSEPVREDGSAAILAYARVGIGMRVVVDVTTADANVGGNLVALAASVHGNRSQGTIRAFSIGMDAPDLNVAMPSMAVAITDESIQKVIEAIGIIKIKFRDPNTTLTPQYLARIECRPAAAPAAVAAK